MYLIFYERSIQEFLSLSLIYKYKYKYFLIFVPV